MSHRYILPGAGTGTWTTGTISSESESELESYVFPQLQPEPVPSAIFLVPQFCGWGVICHLNHGGQKP